MTGKINRKRKPLLSPEDVDRVARQNVQLMTELWIVKDRLALLESMLEAAGLLSRAALNRAVPEGPLAQELETERNNYIRRVLHDDPERRTVESLKALANPHTP
jgi:hypothetical protein